MRKMKNTAYIQGNVFEHKLTVRQCGPNSKNPGLEYIAGTIDVAIDNVNTVRVTVGYTPENTKKIDTYNNLKAIINGSMSRVKINGDLETNDFYTRDGERAQPQIVMASFINNAEGSNNYATFDTDMLITNYRTVERDEDVYGEVSGYVFDFRNQVYPIKMHVRIPGGMEHFENAEPSEANPYLTRVKGEFKTNTVVSTIERDGGAFGDVDVVKRTREFRSWEINWAANEPYDYGDESVMTLDDFQRCVMEREEKWARELARVEARRGSVPFAEPASNVSSNSTATSGYQF